MRSRGCSSIQKRSVSAHCYRRWPAYTEESAEVDSSHDHERNTLSNSRSIRSPGQKGSRRGETYAWADLMFENSETGEVKNVTDAFNGGNGWIGKPGDTIQDIIQYWDNSDPFIEPYFTGVSTDSSLNSWQGYYVYARNNNVSLSRQD